MTKTKQPKPIKGWGIVNKKDRLLLGDEDVPAVYKRKSRAELLSWPEFGERVVRVEITVTRK